MANTLRFKRGLAAGLPASVAGEPLFTTDTFDLYIGNGTTNTRFQKYIASGTTAQYLRGDGSLATFPTNIVTGTGVSGQVAYWSGTNTQVGSNNLFWDNTNARLGVGTNTPSAKYTQSQAQGVFGRYEITNANADQITGSWDVYTNTLVTPDFFGKTAFKFEGGINNAARQYQIYVGDISTPKLAINGSGSLMLGSVVSTGQRLQVTGDTLLKGSGNTSATAALRVQNSDTLQLFSILNNGNIGIPDASLSGYSLNVNKSITGSIISAGIWQNGSVLADVSTVAIGIYNFLRIQASTAINSYQHFRAESAAFGAGATLGTQIGFIAENSLTGATNNYGFYGNIASGTGRWNLYMNGTAANYLGGALTVNGASVFNDTLEVLSTFTFDGAIRDNRSNTVISQSASSVISNRTLTIGNATYLNINFPNGNMLIGSTTDSGEKLQVNGTMKVTGASTFARITATTSSIILDYNSGILYHFGGSGDYYQYISGADYRIANRTPTGSLSFATNDTNRLTIASTGAATFSSSVTAGGNLLLTAGTASTIGAMNLILTGTSPVASRLTFGTDGTGYSFAIGKNQAGTVTDLFSILDSGAATFSSSVTSASATITGNLAVDSTTLFVDATANEVGIGTNAPNSVLQVVGSVSKSISDVKTANYTATATDHTILCSAASGGFTITLPAASGITGRIYVIKKTNASSGVNSVTVDGNGSETIDGSASINLACKSSVMLQCDGSNWHILSLYSDTSCL